MLAAAVVLGLGAGTVGAAAAAPPAGPGSGSARATQAVQAPLIDSVQPFASGTVRVTVTPGDTAQEAVAAVDVAAYALDDSGNATGAPVATGRAQRPDPANPPVVEISGLANDVNYAFTATETTAGGVVSGTSPAFIGGPQTPKAPLAPTLAGLLGRDTGVIASWNPAHPNGSPVTAYTVTATPNGPGASVTTTVAGDVLSTTVTGLVGNRYYFVTVSATNAAGTGPTAVSDSQTTGANSNGTVLTKPAYAASAPQDVSAGPPPVGPDGSQPDPTALKVTWDSPQDDGGNTITGYTVDATAAGQPTVSATVSGTAKEATLLSLAPGVEYAVTVTALQQDGNRGATSAPAKAAPAPTLKAGTVFLSKESVASVTKLTGSTVAFTNPPAQVTGLKVKNIIVVGESANPLIRTGLLRIVDKISTEGGTVTLTTSQAALQQAFQNLDFSATGSKLTSGSEGYRVTSLNPKFQAAMAPRGSGPGAEKTFTLDLAEKINDDPKTKEKLGGATVTAKLTAALSLSTNWAAAVDFKQDPNGSWYTLPTFTYDFSATATAKASINGEFGIAYKHESQREALVTIKPQSCLFVYGIAFCPELTVYTQTSIDGSIRFSFSASYERTMGGRVFRDYSGNSQTEDLTKDAVTKFDYTLNAAAKVTFAFPVSFKVLIYGVVGPEVEITPAIEVTADTSANPWLTVKAPLKVSAFFLLDVKLTKFAFGDVVFNKTFDLYQAPGPFPGPSLSGGSALAASAPSDAAAAKDTAAKGGLAPADDRTPASGTALTATHQYHVTWPAGCNSTQAVTWYMASGSLGRVDQTGLYSPPHPLPSHNYVDVITATTAGSAGCAPATLQAAVHHGASLPAAPKQPVVSADGTTVSWTAAGDGGSPILEYVVTVVNDPGDPAGAETVLATVPGTATSLAVPADRIAQIEADGAQVQVTAVNARGQGPASPLSNPAPATNPILDLRTSQATVGGTIQVHPTVVNGGRSDATEVRYQLSYPEAFGTPTSPSACTIDTANRVLTCDTGALASGHHRTTPLISFSVGALTPGTSYPLTMTRVSASPVASDPNNGTFTLSCTADPAGKVTCA
ncbi:fibronectin type III domain-containing protein [Kitasatospora sp. NPDC036755]|uniref:fibronectin type III domain-containing protein n=1 Tax=Kitasatospora sp. NPDC036755 TaxID=3154600 RepID=UPI0033EA8AC2